MIKFIPNYQNLTRTLSENYKWEFRTFDFMLLLFESKLIFFTIRYSIKYRKDWKELKEHNEMVETYINRNTSTKIKRELELGFLNITWYKGNKK